MTFRFNLTSWLSALIHPETSAWFSRCEFEYVTIITVKTSLIHQSSLSDVAECALLGGCGLQQQRRVYVPVHVHDITALMAELLRLL